MNVLYFTADSDKVSNKNAVGTIRRPVPSQVLITQQYLVFMLIVREVANL